MSRLYRYCGLILRSALEFPELPEISDDPTFENELIIRWASVPFSLPDALQRTATYEYNRDEILWRLPGVGRYLVTEGGRLIMVEAERSAEPGDIRLFLLRPVFSLAALLQGEWMLSAAAVERNGLVSAFIGPSASGKSTVAAAMLQRGYRLVCDSLLRITRSPGRQMLAHPQAPWLWLWPDVIEHLNLEEKTTERLRSVIELRRVPFEITERPLPLARVAVLQEQRGDDLELFAPTSQLGLKSFELLLNHVAGATWLGTFADRRSLFFWSTQIASATLVEQLDIPWGLDRLETLRKHLEHWEKGQLDTVI